MFSCRVVPRVTGRVDALTAEREGVRSARSRCRLAAAGARLLPPVTLFGCPRADLWARSRIRSRFAASASGGHGCIRCARPLVGFDAR